MSVPNRQHVVHVKSDKVLDRLECGICNELFSDPMVTKCCGQTYCRKCVNEWLNGRNTCPNCRSHLTVKDVHRVRALSNMIDELSVRCPYHRDGCPLVVEFGQLASHAKRCQHRLCDCGFRGSSVGHNCIGHLLAEATRRS